MVALPEIGTDPTLEAIDRALEAKGNRPWRAPSLPMSAIGMSCERAIWYGFRWVALPQFDSAALKRFADGYKCEDQQAERLRLVDGVELWTIDPATGKQFEVKDHNGHFTGRVDGVIVGLLQAPHTVHIWEHKSVEEKSLRKLEKIKADKGEKQALREWKPHYWATAQCYMEYFELTRHYMTVSSPGGRRTVSIRTNYEPDVARKYIDKAERIINSETAPPRVSDNPSWYECKSCEFYGVCHGGELPPANCRTCLRSTPAEDGKWHCQKWDYTLNRGEQRMGCTSHLYLPTLVPGEQTDAGEDWVEYTMPDGTMWRNGVCLIKTT